MQITPTPSILKSDSYRTARSNLQRVLIPLSLIIVLIVFWCLKLTGITMADEAFCGKDEHIHDDTCRVNELICLLEETEGHCHEEACILQELRCEHAEVPPHFHDEMCLSWELICTMDEAEPHFHDDSCRQQTLTCPLEEVEGHTHEDLCFVSSMICTDVSEEHIHSDECYELLLVCEEEEIPQHTHGESCYTFEEEWICGLEETAGHAHSAECYAQIENSFLCGLEETEGHTHTADCYYVGFGFGCGLTEAEGHIHTEECLTDETELGCGIDAAPAHTHDETCYILQDVCPLEVHIHEESCYSDIHADLESEDDWEQAVAALDQETTTGRMLAAVAQSQLGYSESTRNFEVDLSGVRRGITRYGQWYGNPYGDWSAMFVSFCLHYTELGDLPANAGPESMRLEWAAEDLYLPRGQYEPRIGDVVFLLSAPEETIPEIELLSSDTAETDEAVSEAPVSAESADAEVAAAVAIITAVDEYGLTIIQGDVDGTVVERTLEAEDPTILGYGLIPERSPYVMLMAASSGERTYLAGAVNYPTSLTTNNRSFVLYTQYNGSYYAIGCPESSSILASAYAVPIEIDEHGNLFTNYTDIDSLLWVFTSDGSNYRIKNVGTGLHLHPGSGENGIIYLDAWSTALITSGNGIKLAHSSSDYGIAYDATANAFRRINGRSNASTFYLGVVEQKTVWLDGTQGNLMSLRGSDLQSYTVAAGSTMTLPSEWKSPDKYEYTLRGWYDVGSGNYYEPGEEIMITANMLLYADWRAATYNIGQMTEDVVETVSTESFITTHVFDYNSLFNTLSQNNDYNPAVGGSSTTWSLVENGFINTTGKTSLNFIFVDHDSSGVISHPDGRNDENGVVYQEVTPDLYTSQLANLLFNPDLDVIGKEYIGTGDYLFQYGDDPADEEHYGFYYYDSKLNAASYNQENGRFYVYDYLERTTDSPGNNSYSDFLPFNSPYANTSDNTVPTYTHNGQNGYVYDARYDGDSNAATHVHTDYALGMAIEMKFYLSAKPGTVDENGTLANQSITGHDMIFEFSGDDDVWVLIDGQMVLDIGGIHLVKGGYIDFSTGQVVVYGAEDGSVSDTGSVTYLNPGEHTLTMYYLERGASMSNFKLRFNLTTRYTMTLRKEDVLTTQQLNGAQFAVYMDADCEQPAQLWNSKRDYEQGKASTNVFTVKNGYAEMWGLAAGNTYYLVEIRGPDVLQGVPAQGIIRMRLKNDGLPDYEVLPDSGNLTVGYTVHGYKVNEDQQEAYLVITNTDATESEPCEVSVEKVWNDSNNHRRDKVTAYLVANGSRIQSITLSEGNNWKHTWVNLPSTDRNGKEVIYTVHESTFPGYVSSVTTITPGSGGSDEGTGDGTLTDTDGFETGKTYLLHTRFGYIGAADNRLLLQSDPDTAQNNNSYLWTATVSSDGRVSLTNKNGQTLYWANYMLQASATPGTNKYLYYTDGSLRHYISEWGQWQYPGDSENVVSNVTYNHCIYTTNSGAALTITPQTLVISTPPLPDNDDTDSDEPIRDFRITNTPVGDAVVSLRVHKVWDLGNLGTPPEYEEASVEMRLLANGEDAGLVGTLNMRNGWSYTFSGLPKYDNRGHEIVYTVNEVETSALWRVDYGPITSINGSKDAYETTVTNVYRATVMLPSTGSYGRQGYWMLGLSIMLVGWSWYRRQKRKDERREC